MGIKLKHAALALLGLITAGLLSISGSIGLHMGPHVGPHIGPTQSNSGMLVVALGDSNTVGQGDTDKASPEFAVTTPQASIPYDMFYGTASSEPVTMTEFGPTTLRNYGAGGSAGFGFEVTLGQQLLVTAATGVTSAAEIKDGSYRMPDTNAGTISLTTGELATHTTIGTSTVSFATNTVPAVITLAVKP